jgi:hypothetical protein
MKAQQYLGMRLWDFSRWLDGLARSWLHQPLCVRHAECGVCGKRHWSFRDRLFAAPQGGDMPVCKRCYNATPF